jgi:hypothetical protein
MFAGDHNSSEPGNPLYPLANEGGIFVRTVPFDYGSLEEKPENMVPIAEVASGLVKILDWCTESKDFHSTGAKIHALRVMLDPINGKFRNLSALARASGLSRGTLSKALITLRDRYELGMIAGKLNGSRAAYSEAQRVAVLRGRHSSIFTKKSGVSKAPQEIKIMTSSQIRNQYNTLSKAVDRIEQLESQLTQLRTAKPVAQTAPLSVVAPQRTLEEITKQLDEANHRGADPDEIKSLYRELVKVRGH